MATAIQIAWLKTPVPAAQTSARAWGVPASVTLAQCILESGWGGSLLAKRANNFFGIKAVQGEDYMEFPTHEVVRGRTEEEMAEFAKYGTVLDCFAAHAHLLSSLPRYKPAMEAAHDPEMFAQRLQTCGYSTNPGYGVSLFQLICEFRLQQYDVPPPDQPAAAKGQKEAAK